MSLRKLGTVDEFRLFVLLFRWLSNSDGDSLPSTCETCPAGSGNGTRVDGVGGSTGVLGAAGINVGLMFN